MTEPFKIKSCPNFRDLGGLRKKSGGFTQFNKIYRSDCLSKLTEEDIALMEIHNIRCVIDLRSFNEMKKQPNPLSCREGFYYFNVSLTDGLYSNDLNAYITDNMLNMYISLIDEAAVEIAEVIRIITNHTNYGIVFHCTAGKDRTGVIAALILQIADVLREDIVSNYAVSYELLKQILERDMEKIRKSGVVVKDHVFMSEPYNMEKFLDYLEKKYISAEKYLLSAGLTDDVILKVKNLL